MQLLLFLAMALVTTVTLMPWHKPLVVEGRVINLEPCCSEPLVELFVQGPRAASLQAGQQVRLEFEGLSMVHPVYEAPAAGTYSGRVRAVQALGPTARVLVGAERAGSWPGAELLHSRPRVRAAIILSRNPHAPSSSLQGDSYDGPLATPRQR